MYVLGSQLQNRLGFDDTESRNQKVIQIYTVKTCLFMLLESQLQKYLKYYTIHCSKFQNLVIFIILDEKPETIQDFIVKITTKMVKYVTYLRW